MDRVFPNGYQMQTIVDKPVAITPKKVELPFLKGPAIGRVTVQSTAAVELKVGGTSLAGRSTITVRNPDLAIAVRIGSSTITEKSGYLLDPQEIAEISLDPANPVAIYGRSTGYEVALEVMES